MKTGTERIISMNATLNAISQVCNRWHIVYLPATTYEILISSLQVDARLYVNLHVSLLLAILVTLACLATLSVLDLKSGQSNPV